jgi:AMP nucleosidase
LKNFHAKCLSAPLQTSSSSDYDGSRFRAFYPEVSIATQSFAEIDSRHAYGHMFMPGSYSTTITRPDLFETYLTDQLAADHAQSRRAGHGLGIGTPIPLHFAFLEGTHVDGSIAER